MDLKYRLIVYNPSGGICRQWGADDFDQIYILALDESGVYRNQPVFLYKEGVNAQSHVDNETTWAFWNGNDITPRCNAINRKAVQV